MNETKTQETETRILIVEDQEFPLEALETAVKASFPNERYAVARSFQSAQDHISNNAYKLIFLDHRLPYRDQGDLETRDIDAYSETLEDRGYSLIPQIRQRNSFTVIIGTSSQSLKEISMQHEPDFTMRKNYGEAEADLENIVDRMKGGGE
jgi:CheY-like chemotaxis protein